MIVLVDQDGVIADFESALNEQILERAHKSKLYVVDPEQRRGWDIEEHYPEELRPELRDHYHETGFFLKLQPMQGAISAMHEMLKSGIDVRICTAPLKDHVTCANEKLVWIKKYLGSEFVNRTIITRDKTLIHGNYLIDDREDISGVVKKPSWKHLLFECHHNRYVDHLPKISWDNWREVLEPIKP